MKEHDGSGAGGARRSWKGPMIFSVVNYLFAQTGVHKVACSGYLSSVADFPDLVIENQTLTKQTVYCTPFHAQKTSMFVIMGCFTGTRKVFTILLGG